MILYSPDIRHRRSIRLKGYDYSQTGAYFVTICTQNRECLFGEVANGEMRLNDAGQMVQLIWDALPAQLPEVTLDAFITMPNHIHGIILIANDQGKQDKGEHKVRPYIGNIGNHKFRRGEPCVRPNNINHPNNINRSHGTSPRTISRIVQAFKSITTREYTIGVKQYGWLPFQGKLWQRNYYEHIVRNEESLNSIREYIVYNPVNWVFDRENPNCVEPIVSDVWMPRKT